MPSCCVLIWCAWCWDFFFKYRVAENKLKENVDSCSPVSNPEHIPVNFLLGQSMDTARYEWTQTKPYRCIRGKRLRFFTLVPDVPQRNSWKKCTLKFTSSSLLKKMEMKIFSFCSLPYAKKKRTLFALRSLAEHSQMCLRFKSMTKGMIWRPCEDSFAVTFMIIDPRLKPSNKICKQSFRIIHRVPASHTIIMHLILSTETPWIGATRCSGVRFQKPRICRCIALKRQLGDWCACRADKRSARL